MTDIKDMPYNGAATRTTKLPDGNILLLGRFVKIVEGKAEAIIAVQSAVAEGIKRINDAKPSEAYIKMKSLESFEKAADGKATKIIIPSEIQNMAGIISSLKEVADK